MLSSTRSLAKGSTSSTVPRGAKRLAAIRDHATGDDLRLRMQRTGEEADGSTRQARGAAPAQADQARSCQQNEYGARSGLNTSADGVCRKRP